MAYYTGQCTSYQNLADILVEHCQKHGWTWQDHILSKDHIFVYLEVKTKRDNYGGVGIILTGGTARHATGLENPSDTRPRLGHPSSFITEQAVFPAIYHLFIFDQEVYLIIKYDTDRFLYLAFGQSAILKQFNPHYGVWVTATACVLSGNTPEQVIIAETYGGTGAWDNALSTVAPFWNRDRPPKGYSNATIAHYLGEIWSYGEYNAFCSFEPLIYRLPTAHFSDSPLLPYNIYAYRPENKLSLVAQFANARFLRIDNHEPEQILTLGHEKWMVLPFYRKNMLRRNGGVRIDHTGTFGWAIRYEG